jgi:AraC family transcriptional regulator
VSTPEHPERTSTLALERYLLGRPGVSSVGLGWHSLVVRTFVEPATNEYLRVPGTPDPFLVLVTAGNNRVECRAGAGWKQAHHRPGHLAVTAPGNPTEIRWWSESDAPVETLHIHVRREVFDRVVAEDLGLDPTNVEIIDTLAAVDPFVEQLALALKRELELGDGGSRVFSDAAAQLLTVHLLRAHSSARSAPPARKLGLPRRKLARVEDYVHANLAREISLEQMAELAGLTAYHFTRVFKSATGQSPHQFVMRLRVEEAMRLLCETRVGVLEVAHAVGYESASQFGAVFRRLTGFSPAAYRRASAPG